MTQNAKRCGRAREHAPVRLDQLDGPLKRLRRDGWKIRGGLLIRTENDASIGQLLSTDHPATADGALAVVHQSRKPLLDSSPHSSPNAAAPFERLCHIAL